MSHLLTACTHYHCHPSRLNNKLTGIQVHTHVHACLCCKAIMCMWNNMYSLLSTCTLYIILVIYYGIYSQLVHISSVTHQKLNNQHTSPYVCACMLCTSRPSCAHACSRQTTLIRGHVIEALCHYYTQASMCLYVHTKYYSVNA